MPDGSILIPTVGSIDRCPASGCDCSDGCFVICEEQPSFAGFVDDIVVAFEDGVGEFVLTQILPDVFGAVEFRRIARQRDEGDVGGHTEAMAAVVTRTIKENRGMGTKGDGLADGVQMQIHHSGIGFGHDDCSICRPAWASGTEEIGPVVALVARRARPCSASGPNARQGTLLADPCFVLEPDFEGLATGRCRKRFGQRFGEVFLKASWASGSLSGCCGRTDRRR